LNGILKAMITRMAKSQFSSGRREKNYGFRECHCSESQKEKMKDLAGPINTPAVSST
jgi:hypothetical protein